jgi:hypothetical protein
VDWGRPHEMEAVGRISQNLTHQYAQIQLARPGALDEKDDDAHLTLVHELIHIFLLPIERYDGEARRHAIEVACNRLSEAFVALAREAVAHGDGA